MAEQVIVIEHLKKVFAGPFGRNPFVAVKDLSFSVSRGASVAFIGPNGAGKTTTIYALLGLITPTAGSVALFGKPPREHQIFKQIGYCPEIFPAYSFLSGRASLSFYGKLSGLTEPHLSKSIDELLELFGLTDAADKGVESYSKGMLQRLGLSQALLHDPDLLILDEPTTGLDPSGRKLFVDVIQGLKARNKTIFFSSHILSDVEKVSDEVVMIRAGELAYTGRVDALSDDSEEWEIEIINPGELVNQHLATQGFEIKPGTGKSQIVKCLRGKKTEVLKFLLNNSVEIGFVRHSGAKLETLYMDLIGKDAR